MSYVARTFRWYEMPAGRTPESYAYKIEEMWNGRETDTLYTDDPNEVGRIIPSMLDGQYDARVTHKGVETLYRCEGRTGTDEDRSGGR